VLTDQSAHTKLEKEEIHATCGLISSPCCAGALRSRARTRNGCAASAPRPSKEHNDWLVEGRGKLTEADVLAKLGHPDEICLAEPPFVIPDVKKIWQDINRIEIDFKDGKVTRIAGRFSPVSPAADLNEEVLHRFKSGMTVAEVEKVFPLAPLEKLNREDKSVRFVWHQERRLSATFDNGKVVGIEYVKGFRDRAK
jgi:hypothetical protein